MWSERQIFAVVLKEGKTMCGRLQMKETPASSYSLNISHVPVGISGRQWHQWFESQVTTLCILGETAKDLRQE